MKEVSDGYAIIAALVLRELGIGPDIVAQHMTSLNDQALPKLSPENHEKVKEIANFIAALHITKVKETERMLAQPVKEEELTELAGVNSEFGSGAGDSLES